MAIPTPTRGFPVNRTLSFLVLALLLTSFAPAARATPSATAGKPDAPRVGQSPAADLAHMREEEKLAHDVYVALGKRWDLPPFQRIPASEQRHMDAMRSLLATAGLPDPAEGKGAGEFSNPELQALYVRLVEKGAASRVDALVVGATIEDLDLRDLALASAATQDETARAVYANLARASRNHLRAFTSLLAAEGKSYTPQFIDASTYASILASPMERGGRGGGGRGCGCRGGCGGGRNAR